MYFVRFESLFFDGQNVRLALKEKIDSACKIERETTNKQNRRKLELHGDNLKTRFVYEDKYLKRLIACNRYAQCRACLKVD